MFRHEVFGYICWLKTLLATMCCMYIGLAAITSTVSLHLGTSSLFPDAASIKGSKGKGQQRHQPAEEQVGGRAHTNLLVSGTSLGTQLSTSPLLCHMESLSTSSLLPLRKHSQLKEAAEHHSCSPAKTHVNSVRHS